MPEISPTEFCEQTLHTWPAQEPTNNARHTNLLKVLVEQFWRCPSFTDGREPILRGYVTTQFQCGLEPGSTGFVSDYTLSNWS